jgi:hypothetical protein
MAYAFYPMKYFFYYFRHTNNVVLAWKDIQDILIGKGIIDGEEYKKINHLILWHDNSKISKEEFDAYAARFYPEPSETDEVGSAAVKVSFKEAWEHHKKENLHHWETLKDYTGSGWKCHLITLVCDWIAMGWETGILAHEYYEKNKDKIQLPLEYKKELEMILDLIKMGNCYANGELTPEKQSRLVFKEEFDNLFFEDRKHNK